MFDHVGFAVSEIERSRRFYVEALAPLGLKQVFSMTPAETESGGTVYGFGTDDPLLLIGDNETVGQGTHIAFRAEDRAAVDAFHRAAIAAGGRDNGAPGIREKYGPSYYAAFVYDPDGINVEAVCHKAG